MIKEEKKSFQSFLSSYRKYNGDTLLPNTINKYIYYMERYDFSTIDGQDLIDKMQEIINVRPAHVLFATFRMYLQFRGIEKHDELYKKLIPPRKRASSASSYRYLQSKVLSKAEVDRLIDESDLFGKMVFSVLFDTGARRHELMSIKMKDITMLRKPKDSIYAMINIFGKGSRARRVYLREITTKYIKEYYPEKIPDKKLIEFYGQDGKPLKCQEEALYYYVKKSIKKILDRELSPHVLRASILTHLSNVGADVLSISKLAGHADIRTTQIYTRGSAFQSRQAFKHINEELE